MNGMSSLNDVEIVKKYLYWEYRRKVNKSIAYEEFNVKFTWRKIPQQNNSHDCGVYVLQYAEQFFSVNICKI